MALSSQFQPIAVIGRGCHLPGASSIEEYWKVIRDDLSTINQIPSDRFDRDLLYDETPGVDFKTYCSKACLVKPVSADRRRDLPLKWKHHPETVITDLISVTQDACRDAGRELEGWAGLRGGVFLGHTRGGSLSGDLAYAQYVAQVAELIDQLSSEVPSASQTDFERWKSLLVAEVRRDMPNYSDKPNPTLGAPVAAMAVADSLCWDGPFVAFNGACASSLQALHAATLSLRTGRVDIAVAAGASCCHSDSLVLFAQARSLSSSDTRPFDEAADGLIIGEGCVVLLLKRLHDAIRDGDKIHGVIRGIGVASDGKGKSLWAPRKEGQMLAIDRAYSSKEEMARVQYVEAHATSTQVGDATEMDALASAFKGVFPTTSKIPVGSVKGNVGHTLESAGLAGLLKTLLCMENEVYPSHQRLKNLSKKIPWDAIQFHVPNSNKVWEADSNGERWAAVNGFGIGGLNAHVVVQSGRIREQDEPKSHVAPHDFSNSSTFANKRSGHVARYASPSQIREYDIAVISTGCILPGALDWNAFLELSNSGERATKPLPAKRWLAGPEVSRTSIEPMASTFGGFIDDFAYDWRRHKVPPKQIASASPLQFMILEAVDQAIRPSGILDNAEFRMKTGVVVGTIFGGDFSNQLQMGLRVLDLKKRLNRLWTMEGFEQETIASMLNRFTSQLIEKMPAIFDETGSFTSSSLASRITKSFDLMGGAVAVDAAHGASGAALAYCVDQLQYSDNKFMVCVGAQQDMGPMKFEGWTKHGWLATDTRSTALQTDANGCFPGEGAGVLLLQKLQKNEKPILPALAYIRGIGASYQRWGDCSFKNSLERAFDQANAPTNDLVNERDVDTVRLSPIGLPAIDESYLEGAGELLNEGNRDVSTAIDQFGHLTGGSGIVECLAAIAKNDSSSVKPMKNLTTFKNSFWAISTSTHRAMDRNVVYIGSPWECVYSVVFDVLKRNNDQ